MVNILKQLKGHIGKVLLIFLLLVVQVYCDLELPQYTSNLVDVGIQQNGIEDAVPSYISDNSLEKLGLFMSDNDFNFIKSLYEKKNVDELKVKPVYVFRGNEEQREKANSTFEKPMLALYMMNNAKESAVNGADKFDLDEIKKAIDVGVIAKADFQKKISEQMSQYGSEGNLPESLTKQVAVQYVKAEYTSLGVDVESIQMDYLWDMGLQMLGYTFVMILAAIASAYIAGKTGALVGRDMRRKIFGKVISFSGAEMDRFSTASLITRSTNDIQQIQMVIVIVMRVVMMAPIMGIAACVKVAYKETGLTWIIYVSLAVILFVVTILMVVAMPKFRRMQMLIDKVNLVSREIITGIPVIRAFSREKYEEKRFDEASLELMKTQLFTHRTMAFMMPIMMLIMNGITLAIVWFGAKGVDLGNLQVGDMMAFITYTMMIVMAFMMLTVAAIILPRAAVAANRIDEVMTTEATIKEADDIESLDDDEHRGEIVFEHVSFHYPNVKDNVIDDITFTVEPGQTTAIIGSTGSGKSTLLNLIIRSYDVSEGQILVNGKNVKSVSLHELRELIGYVPQKGVLFSGDISSNLKFASAEITDEEMIKAARIAQATDFIEEKEEKYNSPISQGGTNVSGGQKQRLSIARAIAKNPQIYLFDDSFSALDYKTDAKLRRELNSNIVDATIVIVAQRIATILHADKILVMDEGKLVGVGTHQELLKNCKTYQEIAGSQLSEEELAKGVK